MERGIIRAREFLRKNYGAALVLLIGLFFMLLPTGKRETPVVSELSVEAQQDMETRLERILSEISGVGSVRVLLTESCGEQRFYQTDDQELTDGDRRELRQNTVTVSGSDRAQGGILTRIVAPVYRGAVVVCQGGDNPAVKLSVVEAVSGATGLPSNRITVLKMK